MKFDEDVNHKGSHISVWTFYCMKYSYYNFRMAVEWHSESIPDNFHVDVIYSH
jgi:hypothetical protein